MLMMWADPRTLKGLGMMKNTRRQEFEIEMNNIWRTWKELQEISKDGRLGMYVLRAFSLLHLRIKGSEREESVISNLTCCLRCLHLEV